MKAKREHRIPLSKQAVELLRECGPKKAGPVFPSPRGDNGITAAALSKAIKAAGHNVTIHGFRTTFKTWCMEQTLTPWAVGEAALAHTLGNATEQAYARSDLFERRRDLMQEWADYVGGAECG